MSPTPSTCYVVGRFFGGMMHFACVLPDGSSIIARIYLAALARRTGLPCLSEADVLRAFDEGKDDLELETIELHRRGVRFIVFY